MTGKDENPDLAKIEAYLAAQPDEARATLEQVRKTIKEMVPEASEAISYGIPAFKYKVRPLAGYAGYKAHCSYFPMSGRVVEMLKDQLAGYKQSKGGFRFPIGEPPSASLIEKLLKARIAQIDKR